MVALPPTLWFMSRLSWLQDEPRSMIVSPELCAVLTSSGEIEKAASTPFDWRAAAWRWSRRWA